MVCYSAALNLVCCSCDLLCSFWFSTAAARYMVNRTGLKQSPCGTPMLVFIFSPVVFPHLTFRFMLLISMYSMCSSSSVELIIVHQTMISSGLCHI